MASKPVYNRQHETTNNIWTTGQIIEANLLNNMQNQIAQNTQGFSNIVSYSDTQPSGDYSQYNQIWLKKANSSTDSIKLAEVKDLDKVVIVSQEQPTDNLNKLWIKDDDNVVQVPSFNEFSQSIEDNIAPLYLNTATYSVGQYVTYENKLYMCQTAVTIPGEWSVNSNHFIQASVAGPLEYEGPAKGGWPNINANILNRLGEENSNRVQAVNIIQNRINEIEYVLKETPIEKGNTKTEMDLDITDEDGNVLVRFMNGEVKTKNFDSKKTGEIHTITTATDLDIADDDGNILVRFADGEVKTKYFNSAITTEARTTIAETDLDITDESGNVVLRIKDGHIKTKNFTSMTRDDITTYVTVKKDGSGDYTTLRGAIDYITSQGDADPVSHPYVIRIYPGTYNVLEDYTQAEIETADVDIYTDGFFGPYISDGMSLVGMGDRDAVILYGYLDPNDYVYRIRNNISTLNTQGNANLENLTVIAENLRYCVHDDFPYTNRSGQYNRIVKNCKFIGLNLHHNPSTTWGGGMSGAGENAIFENCDFGTDYGHHFNGTESVRIIFRNCKGRKLRLAERLVTVNHHVIIENSQFEMISLMRPNYVTSQHIFIESNGCEKAYISCSDNDVVITGAIVKTALTGLPIGTLVRRSNVSGNAYQSTNDLAIADGIIVANDDYFSYIQRTGYINTKILGLTNYNIGDYVTIDASNKLVLGGTTENAVGIVSFICRDSDSVDSGIGFIKMIIGGI